MKSKTKNDSKAEWVRSAMAEHAGPLTRYAARITGDIERARDVVQDTFLKLCAADRAKIDCRLAPWLFTVCRNRALDVCRKERRMSLLTEGHAAALASAAPGPAAVAERHETHGRVLRVLDTLPEKQQEVVRLKFQNGLSYKEISAVTGFTVSNVGFLLHTAIKTIRQRLDAESESIDRAWNL